MSRTPGLTGRDAKLSGRSSILSGTWEEQVPDNESYRKLRQKLLFAQGS